MTIRIPAASSQITVWGFAATQLFTFLQRSNDAVSPHGKRVDLRAAAPLTPVWLFVIPVLVLSMSGDTA